MPAGAGLYATRSARTAPTLAGSSEGSPDPPSAPGHDGHSSFTQPTHAISVFLQGEAEQLDRVAAGDLVHRRLVEMPEELFRHLGRIGPGAVRMGIVGLEENLVRTDPVQHVDADVVFEEAAENSILVVARGQFAGQTVVVGPQVGQPGVIGSFPDERDPPDLALGVRPFPRWI